MGEISLSIDPIFRSPYHFFACYISLFYYLNKCTLCKAIEERSCGVLLMKNLIEIIFTTVAMVENKLNNTTKQEYI